MKGFSDLWYLLVRHMKKIWSSPIWFFLGLLQPVLYLILYMPLLRNVGNTSALPLSEITQIFVPGMIIIMGISTLFAGFGFIPELREGFITRLLVSPVSRTAILTSYILSQVLRLLAQVLVLLIIAFVLGLRVSVMGVVLVLVLTMLIGTAMAAASYIISIATKSEDALASMVNTLYLPIMLLSGIMLPISLAPQWLKDAAAFNPFYYAVEASRALFLGHYTDPVIAIGFALMAAFGVVAVWYATVSLQKLTA